MVAATLAGTAQAQVSPEQAIAARKAHFKTFGASMKTMTGFVRNGQGTAGDVQKAAQAIAVLSPRLATWFPAGTAQGVGKSEALPAIWSDNAGFRKAAANLDAQAKRMVTVAATGDKAAIGAQLGALGGTCKGCHDKYKAED